MKLLRSRGILPIPLISTRHFVAQRVASCESTLNGVGTTEPGD